jgi:hypothetical protein
MKIIYVVTNKYNPLAYFSTRELAKEYIAVNGDLCGMWIVERKLDAPIERMELV